MSAGTAYAKRYGAGFVDLPTKTTPVDQQFLNAVEAALLQLIGSAPTADGQVAQWDNANTRFGPALLLNKNVDPAAAIAKSKLDFTGGNGIVDADISGVAAIARSKLNFGSGLVNADIAAAAAIVASKLAGYPTDVTKGLRGDGSWAAQELAYTEFTGGVAVNSTTESAGNTVVTASAITVDGATPVLIEFFAPQVVPASALSAFIYISLFEGATQIGRLGIVLNPAASTMQIPVRLSRRLTPTAGAHTYTVTAHESGGAGSIGGGAGGTGAFVPGFIRIVRAN